MRLTDPPGFPPAARIASSAACRSKPSSDPVTTTVLPVSGPSSADAARAIGRTGSTPAAARSSRTLAVAGSANQAPTLAATTGPTPCTASKRSAGRPRSSPATRASQPSGPCIGSSGPGGQAAAIQLRHVERGLLAHLRDAQRVQDPAQRPDARPLDGRGEVLGALAREAVERHELLDGQPEEVAAGPHHAALEQLAEHGPAHALDVHAAAAHEVTELLADARRAREVGAVVADRAGVLDHGGPADGAARRASRTRARCRHAPP